MSTIDDFSGKVVVVTGGARGIGRRIAERFYAAGATVAICSKSKEGKQELMHEIAGDDAHRIWAAPADLQDIQATTSFLDSVVEKFGRVDILVSNAGVFLKKPTIETTEEEYDRLFDTNVKALFFAGSWFAKHVISRGGTGVIVATSSNSGRYVTPDNAVYCPSKAAVDMMVKCMARDWGKHGIRVNAVAPGSTPTDLNAAMYAKPGVEEALCARLPLGRRATTDDIADATLFLASDQASYITGDTLLVDGGMSIS